MSRAAAPPLARSAACAPPGVTGVTGVTGARPAPCGAPPAVRVYLSWEVRPDLGRRGLNWKARGGAHEDDNDDDERSDDVTADVGTDGDTRAADHLDEHVVESLQGM